MSKRTLSCAFCPIPLSDATANNDCVKKIVCGDSNALMESVIRTAHEHAKSGDTVLLAPACASMDQFNSYGDRGDRFRAAVEKVVRDGK